MQRAAVAPQSAAADKGKGEVNELRTLLKGVIMEKDSKRKQGVLKKVRLRLGRQSLPSLWEPRCAARSRTPEAGRWRHSSDCALAHVCLLLSTRLAACVPLVGR